MRNQVGIPPLNREIDTGAAPTPTLTGGSPRIPNRRPHAGMDPAVAEAARHDDLPYVGGFDKPITERDTNVGLYVGLLIGAIALALVGMVIFAFI